MASYQGREFSVILIIHTSGCKLSGGNNRDFISVMRRQSLIGLTQE